MNQNKQEIEISATTLLMEIQNSFTGLFPYLKIEFLEKTNEGKISRNSYMDGKTVVSHLKKNIANCTINVEAARTVFEICNDFKTALALETEVYRKSGNIWNLISVTGGWTLQSQNEAGKYISSVML